MRKLSSVLALLTIAVIYVFSFSAPVLWLTESNATEADPLQYALEGLTRSPAVAMTTGSLGGWGESDWVPFRLTIINTGVAAQTTEAAIDLEYQNIGRFGIDAFAACFSESADCGSGPIPILGPSAVGSGSLWRVLVDSSEQTPVVSFGTVSGSVQTIHWRLGSLSVPAGSSLSLRWAGHLAKGDAADLACAAGSPLGPCSPGTVPSGMGESSWPGRSLQVRTASPIPGERTVSIDVARQAGCLVATAAYGSELAAPVQFLRSFRDEEVQATLLGAGFLEAFNPWYYSWSPAVARAETQSNPIRLVVRFLVTPIIGALIISRPIFHMLTGLSPELAILSAGLAVSVLIGIIYLTPVFLLVSHVRILRLKRALPYLALVGFMLALLGTLPYGTLGLTEILAAMIVLQTILISPALITRMLVGRKNP